MKTPDKQDVGLLILNRENFYIFTPRIAGFLTLTFPIGTVRNLEILNQQDLENKIGQFVETSKVAPAELTILLSSDILFEKEIAGGPEEAESRQKFLDSLPFESVYKIIIPKDQKPYMIAVNRDFVDGIIRGFSNLGFNIVRAVPNEFLRKNSIEKVDVNNAMDIIKKAEGMKLYNMLDFQQKKQAPDSANERNGKEKGESKLRLYSLISVLAVMGILLIYILLTK